MRVSDAEHDALAARAALADVSLPRLLVELALQEGRASGPERRARYAALLATRRQLIGVATNLNQLAKWANTERRWTPEAERAARAVATVLRKVEAAIEGLER